MIVHWFNDIVSIIGININIELSRVIAEMTPILETKNQTEILQQGAKCAKGATQGFSLSALKYLSYVFFFSPYELFINNL